MGVLWSVVAGWLLGRWLVSTSAPWDVDPCAEIVPRPVGEGCLERCWGVVPLSTDPLGRRRVPCSGS